MVQQEDKHKGVGPLLVSDTTLRQVTATLCVVSHLARLYPNDNEITQRKQAY